MHTKKKKKWPVKYQVYEVWDYHIVTIMYTPASVAHSIALSHLYHLHSNINVEKNKS